MDGSTMPSSTRRAHWILSLGLCVVFGVILGACSRSAWMKPDGREVSPNEQLACAEEIREAPENRTLNHDEIQPKIDNCMKAKGYHRRPWWLLNDLHWNITPPS
ncbi:MAG: hypothetical protein MRJ96_16760 [Nitrospirales bacterium]|nr:hypothetical protein [Nitrospira sp.]MDR4503096.1 hypothetical protein [Nitrospirales bacterium]